MMTEFGGYADQTDDPSSSISSLSDLAGAEKIDLDIDIEDGSLGSEAVVYKSLTRAVVAAVCTPVHGVVVPTEIYVRIVGLHDSQQLNCDYRGKDKPTNVLSFPAIHPNDIDEARQQAQKGGPPLMLGDIIIAAPVIIEEAEVQHKTIEDHLAHMVVHGVLHLMGYDHIDDQEAETMEDLERDILAGLGIADPYQSKFSDD